LFRIDRVVRAEVLPVDGTPPPGAVSRDVVSEPLFRPSEDDEEVTLDLAPAASWVSEYYPVESTEPGPDGRDRVRLRAADVRWVARLVLRMGGEVTVVAPASLAERTADEARRALEAYSEAYTPERADQLFEPRRCQDVGRV
jgi:proteasome accessory factor C